MAKKSLTYWDIKDILTGMRALKKAHTILATCWQEGAKECKKLYSLTENTVSESGITTIDIDDDDSKNIVINISKDFEDYCEFISYHLGGDEEGTEHLLDVLYEI